ECLEGLAVPKELRHTDQKVSEQRLRLARVLAQQLEIVRCRRELVDMHAALDPANARALLVVPEVVAGLRVQQGRDLAEIAAHFLPKPLDALPLQRGEVP